MHHVIACGGPAGPFQTVVVTLLACLQFAACSGTPTPRKAGPSTAWMLGDARRVGGHETEVVGSRKGMGTCADGALVFDGQGDGVFLSAVPIAGWQTFTIQVRFKPDGTGGEEQRFLHLEDEMKHRVLME